MNWQPVPTHPHYEVSDSGQVRRASNHKPLYAYDKGGRITINLFNAGKPKTVSIARLVVTAFRGAIPEGYHVFHTDGNYANNHLANLYLEKRGYK